MLCGRASQNASQKEHENNRLDLCSSKLSKNQEVQQEIRRRYKVCVSVVLVFVFVLYVSLIFDCCLLFELRVTYRSPGVTCI